MSCTDIFQSFKTEIIKDFSSSFVTNSQNNYFLSIGRSLPWSRDTFAEINNFDSYFYLPFTTSSGLTGDDLIIPESIENEFNKSKYRLESIIAKRITDQNFSFLIPRYNWTAGQTYDAYDDTENLFNPRKKFFTFHEEDKGIYKCLLNNEGASSSNHPEESYTETPFILEDGYKWKLIAKVDPFDDVKFSINSGGDISENYIPIKNVDFNYNLSEIEQNQFDIQNSAVPGSIESVKINLNYKDNITFDEEKCVVGEESSCYVYTDATAGSNIVEILPCLNLTGHPSEEVGVYTDYLKDLVFNVVSGVGAGQRRIITQSQIVNGLTTDYIKLELDYPLDYGVSGIGSSTPKSFFNIEPQIKVVGDGTSFRGDNLQSNSQLIKADFQPLFKLKSGNTKKTLDSIEIVNMGRDYTRINSTFVSGITHHYPNSGENLANDINSFNTNYNNFLTPILPPAGGHGSNPISELGTDKILFKVNLDPNVDDMITSTNDFRQLSLIKNPLLNDPIVQFRFVEKGTSNLVNGYYVFYGGPTGNQNNTGRITRVFNFPFDAGNEIFVSGVSGSFDGATTVYISQNLGDGAGTTFSVDPFDGYRKFEIAGSENKTNLLLEVQTTESNTYFPRDILVGLGSSQNSTYPSHATGMIKNIKTVGNKKIFTLDEVKGVFKIGEKIGVVNKPTSEGVSNFQILNNSKVLSYRYTRENYKDSYSFITKVTLNSASGEDFTVDSFYEGQPIYSFSENQQNTDILNDSVFASGHIYAWTLVNNTTVILELVGCKEDSFIVNHYVPYLYIQEPGPGELSMVYGQITSVEEPDIKYNSGEILYLQNFSPLERSSTTKEELNLIVGI